MVRSTPFVLTFLALTSFSILLAEGGCENSPPRFDQVLGLRGEAVGRITSVAPGSVAEINNLRPGDLLVGYNGKKLADSPEMDRFYSDLRIAAIVGQTTIDVLKYEPTTRTYRPEQISVFLAPDPDSPEETHLGVTCPLGFLVQDVIEGGAAERMGIRPGEFIQEINGHKIGHLEGIRDFDFQVQEIAASPDPELTVKLATWEVVGDGSMTMHWRLVHGSL